MKTFNATVFLRMADVLGDMAGIKGVDNVVVEESYKTVAILKKLEEESKGLGLNLTSKSMGKAVKLLSGDTATHGQLGKLAHEIQERLFDESESIVFLAIEPTLAGLYSDSFPFGKAVADQFPSVGFDVEEAGKCLALNRATACVFHLMRVLEIGLYTLANDLGIGAPEENWHNAIEQIQAEIDKKIKANPGKKSPAHSQWKTDVEFYSESAAQFMYMKEPWRNRTAHAGKTYTPEKARSIFDRVREFMQHLATRLQE